MSQVTNPERNAIDPQVIARAIAVYLTSTDPQDERDVALESDLLYQGVMAPHEIASYIDVGDEWVTICLESGVIFNIYADGTTEVF
jgi:hypothetical protein